MSITEERTAMVARLYAAGLPSLEIAARVGICRRAVDARIARIPEKVERKRGPGQRRITVWTTEQLERLKALWAEGWSASQIAADLGNVSRNAVLGKVHRLGLSGRIVVQRAAAPVRAAKEPRRVRTQAEIRETERLRAQAKRRAKGIEPRGSQPRQRPVAAAPAMPFPPLNIAFAETARDHCRWICSDDGEPVTVCGHQAVNETSWCAFHAGVVFDPPRGRVHRAALDKHRPSQSTRWRHA